MSCQGKVRDNYSAEDLSELLLLCDRGLRNQSEMQKVSFPQAESLTASTLTAIKIHWLFPKCEPTAKRRAKSPRLLRETLYNSQ